MSNKSELQSNNNDIQALINKAKTLPNKGTSTSLPTLSNPATTNKVLEGYEYIDAGGNKKMGTIPSQSAKTVTPSKSDQLAVPAGTYVAGDVTIAGDENLVSENIVSGKTIFGVSGSIPPIITSTTSVVVGTSSPYPNGTLYVVYEEW